MATVHDFVEEWIEIRAKLQRQLKPIDQAAGSSAAQNSATTTATVRIKKCIEELNALLKEHVAADRT